MPRISHIREVRNKEKVLKAVDGKPGEWLDVESVRRLAGLRTWHVTRVILLFLVLDGKLDIMETAIHTHFFRSKKANVLTGEMTLRTNKFVGSR